MNPLCPVRSLTLMPAGTITASTSRDSVKGSLSKRLMATPPGCPRCTTGSACECSAASSVCQQRLAHLTRAGNSRTPDKAPSLPSGTGSIDASGLVSSWCIVVNRRSASAIGRPLTLSVSSDAEATEMAQPLPSNETSPDRVALEPDVQRQPVAAQRVETLRVPVRVRHRAEVPRVAVVVDDHVAVEVLEVHQANIPRASCTAAASRSTSSCVL